MKVWCKYCSYYPQRRKQPGSNRCIEDVTSRSPYSQACEPKLTLMGRIRRFLGLPIG
ncbi:MAG: hypothetical protein ACYC6C_08760 [Coriobacteriia bacterium]